MNVGYGSLMHFISVAIWNLTFCQKFTNSKIDEEIDLFFACVTLGENCENLCQKIYQKKILFYIFSDSAERREGETEAVELENGTVDSGYDGECPASPITVPSITKSMTRCTTPGSQIRSPKPRRQRTTSTSQNSTKHESIIRANNRTIYTAGRPPWYNCAGQQVEPFVIGICGGSASGKTTVAQKIIESLDVPWVTLLSMDCFYKILNRKQHEQAQRNEYNFDHPEAFDIDLLVDTLKKLKDGRKVEVPIYNFVTHSRETTTVSIF